MWHFASLPFAFLVLTTLLQLMFLTARRGRQTSSGRMKGWVGPLRRSALQEVGGMRDEEDGGPSWVLRCEARFSSGFWLVWNLLTFFSLSPLLLFHLGTKDMQILVREYQKQQQNRKCFLCKFPQIHPSGGFQHPGFVCVVPPRLTFWGIC